MDIAKKKGWAQNEVGEANCFARLALSFTVFQTSTEVAYEFCIHGMEFMATTFELLLCDFECFGQH